MTTYLKPSLKTGFKRLGNSWIMWTHPTKYTVKLLAGPQKGQMAAFATLEDAQIEARYQNDENDLDTFIREPICKMESVK